MSVWPPSSSASRTAATWPSIMPERPEQLRARAGLRERHRRVPLEGGVVVDAPAVVEHAAVAVVGELVEAQVGLHDEPARGCLDGDAGRDVEDAVGVGGARAACVAHLGHAEQHHAADAGGRGIRHRLRQALERVLHDARHRRDRHRGGHALAHEQRQHELRRVQAGLGRRAGAWRRSRGGGVGGRGEGAWNSPDQPTSRRLGGRPGRVRPPARERVRARALVRHASAGAHACTSAAERDARRASSTPARVARRSVPPPSTASATERRRVRRARWPPRRPRR